MLIAIHIIYDIISFLFPCFPLLYLLIGCIPPAQGLVLRLWAWEEWFRHSKFPDITNFMNLVNEIWWFASAINRPVRSRSLLFKTIQYRILWKRKVYLFGCMIKREIRKTGSVLLYLQPNEINFKQGGLPLRLSYTRWTQPLQAGLYLLVLWKELKYIQYTTVLSRIVSQLVGDLIYILIHYFI